MDRSGSGPRHHERDGGRRKMTNFVKCALIRAVRTIAQTAIATIGSAVAMSDVNWVLVGSASLLAGILSILTSIVTGLPEVEKLDD